MTDKIEDWAWQRAADLVNADGSCLTAETIQSWSAGKALARYIMQHETAPVDPLLIEAREIAAKYCDAEGIHAEWAEEYRSGRGDDRPIMRCAYAAIKAGAARNG